MDGTHSLDICVNLASIFAVLVGVSDDHEEEINKPASYPELLVFRVWIGMGD